MYLKRIEISGFKSFAQKTVLDFLPASGSDAKRVKNKNFSIASIVGPNGSGKSNVADAIKWAMGEQSIKSLRGKKSEDVIFAGSGKKAQLGSAKVSLFFDNSDKAIPIEFQEVVITRKIYRSGEGEYFINGSRVRLIDIVDLLAKAGVGQRSYCIINQGMADSVLNAAPAERRVILEEAAGVKPFQLKKERSVRKLESTRNNLDRANDLLREIEPHLKVLKRQSEKARRGEDVAKELREKQEILYSYQWQRIGGEKARILAEKEEYGREEMKIQRKIDDLEILVRQESKSNIEFENQRDILEQERQMKFEKMNKASRDLSIIEAKIEIEKEKAKNFQTLNEIPINYSYIKEKINAIKEKFTRLEERMAKINTLEELAKYQNEFSQLGLEIKILQQEVLAGKKKVVEEPKKENIVNLRLIGDLEKNKAEFQAVLQREQKEIDENKEKMKKLIEENRENRRRYFEMENELRKKQQELSIFREKINEARIRMAKIEVREEDLAVKIKEELNMHDAKGILEKKSQEDQIDIEKYEKDIGRLKTLLDQIGSIDPLIVEEYEETQKRFDFLTSQSGDLEKAIVSLSEIIKEMDEKIKESFEETYKKVNEEFSKYFKIIFGGGNAELQKVKMETRKVRTAKKEEGEEENDETDEESVEEEKEKEKEIGIDIKACPPGKRISGLAMLSGGERALTSLALLFAIISQSPPPFAVLDEVEAALDEANSKRFGRILQELANETQFILITHNRETMRQASLLYGVTMGADGISKVLSVKLDQVGSGGEIK